MPLGKNKENLTLSKSGLMTNCQSRHTKEEKILHDSSKFSPTFPSAPPPIVSIENIIEARASSRTRRLIPSLLQSPALSSHSRVTHHQQRQEIISITRRSAAARAARVERGH